MEELIQASISEVPDSISKPLELSNKSTRLTEHKSVKEFLKQLFMANVVLSNYAKESIQKTLDFLELKWGEGIKGEVSKLVCIRINQASDNPNIAPALPIKTQLKKKGDMSFSGILTLLKKKPFL